VGTKRIAIMTGGGDVPGLNSVIKGVVYRSTEMGFEVIGIRRGWEGLTHVNLEDPASRERYITPLSRESTRTIDRSGGTSLHTSRTNPAKMESLPPHLDAAGFARKEITKRGETLAVYDLTEQVLRNLEQLRIDHLIAVGGDDTLSYAAALSSRGVKVIAIPKTMDNDVRNTEYCIGCSTAMTRATAAIQRQRTTVGSHERIGVFRIFGRDSGYTALYTAYVTSIRCAIPEHPFKLEKMIDLLLKDKRDNPSNYSLVVLSEGASWEGFTVQEAGKRDAYGHRKKVNIGEAFSEELGRLGEETVLSDLTYDLRSGEPDFIDKMVAVTFANMAVDCILQGKSGLMTGIVDGCYAMAPIPDPKLGPRKIDVPTMYHVERYRPKYADKLGLPLFLTRA
jgi:ATP-dependent phosphofructokinase / diphosphate-dependent phosphofructokinase